MSINWDFVVPVDESVFKEFERNYGIEVPEDLRELVLEANAGNPDPCNVTDEEGNERVIGTILSYSNKVRTTVFKALKRIPNKKYIPFAVDPLGNYFCENLLLGDIIFYDHETSEFINVADSLDEMIKKIH